MKNSKAKIPKNFRLDPEIARVLSEQSEALGIPETRILEDALRHFLGDNMRKQLTAKLKGLGSPFEFPLAPDPMPMAA